MINVKRYKKSILFFAFLIILSTLLLGCNNRSQHQNKIGFIDKNNISQFRIHNIELKEVEIKNKSDRDKIVDLINSVKIANSGVEPRDGIGFGVIITYSNGDKLLASYLSSTMAYAIDDNKTIWCDIDKDIVNDLRNYYDRN